MSELLLQASPPPSTFNPNTHTLRLPKCPKCNSPNLVVHSENLSTGTAKANTERKPSQVLEKTVRRVILRCLSCNHKWAEYWT